MFHWDQTFSVVVVQFIHVSLKKPLLHLVWLINILCEPNQISRNFNAGSLEIGRFLEKQSVSIFLSNCACAAFNWVLSMMKTNPRITGFFVSLPFLTYLCYKD